MRLFWILPITALIIGAGWLIRARRRGDEQARLTSEPVSDQWLAEARSRDQHP